MSLVPAVSESRREFFKQAAALALATAGGPLLAAEPTPVKAASPNNSESLVKLLYETFTEKQKAEVCFAWDYKEQKRGLLRTRLENNWKITKPSIKSAFYTADQQHLIRKIFEGMTNPEWLERWDRQLQGDVGGFGRNQSLALFGDPASDKFEFVLASRHMTLRCDGNSAEHLAFGGPILYAHEGEDLFEKPSHPSNVFWHQAVAANKLYDMFDGKQRKQSLVLQGMPSEELVGFRGKQGKFDGIAVTDLSTDQQEHLQSVLKLLIEPFRQSDQDTVVRCLKEGDLGDDGIWDNWRLEGPSFVWYFRGKPHVHVWVHVANTPEIELNSYQNSVGV